MENIVPLLNNVLSPVPAIRTQAELQITNRFQSDPCGITEELMRVMFDLNASDTLVSSAANLLKRNLAEYVLYFN